MENMIIMLFIKFIVKTDEKSGKITKWFNGIRVLMSIFRAFNFRSKIVTKFYYFKTKNKIFFTPYMINSICIVLKNKCHSVRCVLNNKNFKDALFMCDIILTFWHFDKICTWLWHLTLCLGLITFDTVWWNLTLLIEEVIL